MNQQKASTSSETIFSSTITPTQGSIFGTFTRTSQSTSHVSTSAESVFGQVQVTKKNSFSNILSQAGDNSSHVDWRISSDRPDRAASDEYTKSTSNPPLPKSGSIIGSQKIFSQSPSKTLSREMRNRLGTVQLDSTETAANAELKRKERFMKKMIADSIFGAKGPTISTRGSGSPLEARTIIHKRPLEVSMPVSPEEGTMTKLPKRHSLRDVHPQRALGLGRKKSLQDHGSAQNNKATTSNTSEAASILSRVRRTSSSIAEQVAASTVIICHDVPEEMNDVSSLRQYFDRFGSIIKIVPNKDKHTAMIGFETHDMAAAAKTHGQFDHKTGATLKIFYTKKVRKPSDKVPHHPNVSSKFKKLGVPSRSLDTFQSQLQSPNSLIYAKTDSEKLALLERIDALLRKQVIRQSDISKAKSCKGTCMDMCPEKERYLRQERKILAMYETRGDVVDHARAVKEYSRSSADQEEPLPNELRPGSVLKLTMHYLLREMMPRLYDGQIADWYDFLWNRSRAIRKDLSVQQICDITAVHINEQCARFHIFCAHELSGQDRMVFDPKINNESLEKTMKSVMDLYQDLYLSSGNGQAKLPMDGSNIAEFFSYYILLNINRTADVLNELQDLPQEIRYDGKIGLAMEAFMALHSNNYVKFFNVVRRATFLQGCIMHRYFEQVRKEAVQTMSKAFSLPQNRKTILFPSEDVIRILNFNGMSDLQSFCSHYGIPYNSDGMLDLSRVTENEASAPITPSEEVKKKSQNKNIPEIISNCRLLPINHQPYSSFDSDGKYIGEHYSLLTSAKGFPETVTKSPPKSKELPFGVNLVDVKNIAKQLFHEIIDEICLSVAHQSHTEAVTGIIFTDIFNEVITESMTGLIETSMNTMKEEKLREELRRRKLKEERIRMEALQKEEQRKRELQILMERKEMDRLKKKREMELLHLKHNISIDVSEEICQTVITSDIQRIIDAVIMDTRLEIWSSKELAEVENIVILQEVADICKSIWKHSKMQECMKMRERFIKLKLKRYFRRWQDRKLLQQRFKILTQTFPNVPIFRILKTQVRELLPKQPHHSSLGSDSFPLDSKVEASLRTPMEIVRWRTECNNTVERSHFDITDKEITASSLPFCSMLQEAKRKQGYQDVKTVWKISLRTPFTPMTGSIESWLLQLFLPFKENFRVFNADKNNHVCCQKISDEQPASDLFGSFSLIIFLPKPNSEEPYQKYWDSIRSELEVLVSNRPAVPAIPLLVFSIGWECSEQMLNEELGFSLLEFSFSRWAVCSIDQDKECILENYRRVRNSVEFLFEEMPALPDLTNMNLRELLENVLEKEYVLPVSQYTALCKKIFSKPTHPVVLVQFYNFVIESLAKIAGRRELSEISWPPTELLDDSEINSWQVGWNNEHNLLAKFNSIIKCKLPPFPRDCEVTTTDDIYTLGMDYAKQVSPNCPTMMSSIKYRLNLELTKFTNEVYLDDRFYADEEEMLKLFDWHGIIDVIICQHLTTVLYHQSNIGDMMVTLFTDDLKIMEKYQQFEQMISELEYSALDELGPEKTTLDEHGLGRTIGSVKPEFSAMVDDHFSYLEYTRPNIEADMSWINTSSSSSLMETKRLLEDTRTERELSSITTEHLLALTVGNNIHSAF